MDFYITKKTHLICFFISVALTAVFFPFIENAIYIFFSSSLILIPTKFYILNFYIWVLILLIPITSVHESIHGITHIIFKGKVSYGFKLIYAYTLETSKRPLSKLKFVVVLLSPLVIISLVCLTLPLTIFKLILFLNMLGSSGDIYMTFIVINQNRKAMIIDEEYGLKIV